MKQVQRGQWVVCRDTGLRYLVLDNSLGEVCAWSEPLPAEGNGDVAGFSWMGSEEEFRECFVARY